MREEPRCPDCGAELVKRQGKHGEFLGCSNYPDCTFTQKLADPDKPMFRKPEKMQPQAPKREFHLSPEQVNTNAVDLAIKFCAIKDICKKVEDVIELSEQFRDFITS